MGWQEATFCNLHRRGRLSYTYWQKLTSRPTSSRLPAADMSVSLLSLIIVSLLLTTTLCQQQYVNVTTSLGIITGLHVIISNIEYYSFRGIRYADVPKRFKASTPVKPWTSAVMATDDGPGCIQIPVFRAGAALNGETEDCLFINVYTPHLPQKGKTKRHRLPVMVFFHGGAFLVGGSTSRTYGPEFFMAEKNVVLVSMNYRIGLLGFLSTGTEDAPGNAGLKDQVLALKWVQQEIATFGGDPLQVTIFGESAGAGSVIHHMLSPMSKGLFHRAIAESGTALSNWGSVDADAVRKHAIRVAEMLSCNTENTTTAVDCLRTMPTAALVQATIGLIIEQGDPLLFIPVIEAGQFDEQVFLANSPRNLIDNLCSSTEIPLIIGVNSDEGMFFISDDDKFYESIDQNLQYCIPTYLKKRLSPDQIEEFIQKLRDFYFNGGKVDKTKLKGFSDLWGDHLFIYPAVVTARKLVEKKNKVYLYKFTYLAGDYKNFWPNDDAAKLGYKGVAHGEELPFLFYSPARNAQNLNDTDTVDYKMMKKMIKLWTTFANTGKPTSCIDDAIKNIHWPRLINPEDLVHLKIDNPITVSHDYFDERMTFWDRLTSSFEAKDKP